VCEKGEERNEERARWYEPFPFRPVGTESSEAVGEGSLVPTVRQVKHLAEVPKLVIGQAGTAQTTTVSKREREGEKERSHIL
jgi:hypothetical protein